MFTENETDYSACRLSVSRSNDLLWCVTIWFSKLHDNLPCRLQCIREHTALCRLFYSLILAQYDAKLPFSSAAIISNSLCPSYELPCRMLWRLMCLMKCVWVAIHTRSLCITNVSCLVSCVQALVIMLWLISYRSELNRPRIVQGYSLARGPKLVYLKIFNEFSIN
jgi:hypothetical protein